MDQILQKNINRLIIFIAILFLAFIPTLSVAAENISGTVISVSDGDTIRVKTSTVIKTIRLACIDAPETSQQPWGNESTATLKQLLPIGQVVTLEPVDTDKYNRLVAEVLIGDRNINVNMVEEGKAVVYLRYLKNCVKHQNSFIQAEKSAKEKSLGFWSQPDPQMPWDFRRAVRSLEISAQKTSGCDPAYPDVCIPKYPPDLNCSDITERNFKTLPPDPHGFDRNHNGIGCEKRTS